MENHRLLPRGLLRLALPLLLVLAGGCNAAWQAYQEAEVGKPLPADNLLMREGVSAPSGRVWEHWAIVNVPAIVESRTVGVATDDQGTVIAKHYEGTSMGHVGIAQWYAAERVLEVQVPPESLHDVPPGWKPREEQWFDDVLRLREWLEPLRKEFAVGDRPPAHLGINAPLPPHGPRDEVQGVLMPIPSRRIRSEVLTQFTELHQVVAVDLAKDVDLSGLEQRADILAAASGARVFPGKGDMYILEVAVIRPKPAPPNVLEYLLEAQYWTPSPPNGPEPKGLDRLTFNSPAFFVMYYAVADKQPGLAYVLDPSKATEWKDRWPHLAGISKEGFDWTYHNRQGGTLRIRNLGGGHIRMDAGTFGLYDPFFLIEILVRAIDRNETPEEPLGP